MIIIIIIIIIKLNYLIGFFFFSLLLLSKWSSNVMVGHCSAREAPATGSDGAGNRTGAELSWLRQLTNRAGRSRLEICWGASRGSSGRKCDGSVPARDLLSRRLQTSRGWDQRSGAADRAPNRGVDGGWGGPAAAASERRQERDSNGGVGLRWCCWASALGRGPEQAATSEMAGRDDSGVGWCGRGDGAVEAPCEEDDPILSSSSFFSLSLPLPPLYFLQETFPFLNRRRNLFSSIF